MNDRIQQLITALGIKKTEFAKRLNISAPFVSELCSGAKAPSDRTIADICREFGVNEEWLRSGDGEMFIHLSREEEIAAFMGEILGSPEDDYRKRLIHAIAKLSPNEWRLLATVAENLVEDEKKEQEKRP